MKRCDATNCSRSLRTAIVPIPIDCTVAAVWYTREQKKGSSRRGGFLYFLLPLFMVRLVFLFVLLLLFLVGVVVALLSFFAPRYFAVAVFFLGLDFVAGFFLADRLLTLLVLLLLPLYFAEGVRFAFLL